ncbi:MAG: rod shape-determining protein RodA [Chloroflexota bacterium]
MLDRRHLRNLDWGLFIAVLMLMAISVTMVSSATRQTPVGGDPFYYTKKQVVWVIIGLAVMVVAVMTDYLSLARLSNLIYFGCVGLLLAVMVPGLGHKALGAQRWIPLGFMQLQPSEVAKIGIIITFANYLRSRERKIERLRDYIGPFLHIGIPLGLIMMQPDLGTSLVFIAVTFGMLYISGAPGIHIASMGLGGLSLASLAVYLHESIGLPIFLKDYQIARLTSFINPKADPLGTGYHLIQSIIAIGSGGFIGKGLFEGTQNLLKFLPIRHTDFIFSVIGEELGFLGTAFVLALYFFIVYRSIRIAASARDLFGSLIATGIVAMFIFHILTNIGMTTGIMPVTGIPLPLMSYGGTSMLINCLAIGMLEGIHMRRQKILF